MTGIWAELLCKARATEASLAGNFKAWLSDNTTDAKDHITTNGPWVRLDGIKIADNIADLTDDSLFSAINVTETGKYYSGFLVWTGTNADGTKYLDPDSKPNNCSNWASASTTTTGYSGEESFADSLWSIYWGNRPAL
jgi:hypothetical protein